MFNPFGKKHPHVAGNKKDDQMSSAECGHYTIKHVFFQQKTPTSQGYGCDFGIPLPRSLVLVGPVIDS